MIDNSDLITMENVVRSAYDRIARQYDSARDRFRNDSLLQLFQSHLPKNSKLILDLGCGSGRVMRIVLEQGFS
jgi:ubiquinone/menaquinone biosynthesis C-methylase UbiE